MGCSGAGKTTLAQALRGERIAYQKTQYIRRSGYIIDTPGEYLQVGNMGAALALYAYEADVVGLLASAVESYCVYPPNITCMVNREVIGIVTKIDEQGAKPELAEQWLKNAGCRTVFRVNAKTGEGVSDIWEYLCKPEERSF